MKAHQIVMMEGRSLLCSCGQELQIERDDWDEFSQPKLYDMLLDLHSLHKTHYGKKSRRT